MKLRTWWAFYILFLAVTLAWGPPLLEGGDPGSPWQLTPAEARAVQQQRHPPRFAARAVLLYDITTDRVLVSQNARTPLPPASLTKLMTALVVRRHMPLDEQVTVPAEALIGEAQMGLQAEETLSVEALLYGLLLTSGNDAAVTLAIASAGSVDTFVAWMNTMAQEMGLEGTRFVNPHGLDAPGHVSTAWDLAQIARAVLNDPVLAKIVATPEIEVGRFHLRNRNRLLGEREDVVGVKTGTTLLAGECLITAFRDGRGHVILTVVLGARDRYAVTLEMWNYYQQTYRWVSLRLPRGYMNRILGPWGKAQFKGKGTSGALVPAWMVRHLRIWRDVALPVWENGAWVWPPKAGRAVFTAGTYRVGEIELVWSTLP